LATKAFQSPSPAELPEPANQLRTLEKVSRTLLGAFSTADARRSAPIATVCVRKPGADTRARPPGQLP
jgi:hypothetical protein